MKTSLSKAFLQDFKLNAIGSISFELLKIGHELALFFSIPMSLYGLKGFLFSILYISISLTDFGFTSGLAPLVKSATQSKKTFLQFITLSILAQLPLLILAGYGATTFATSKFPNINNQFPLLIIALLITTEGIRMFLRALLHMTFTTKPTIIAELTITSLYLISVWTTHLILKLPISLKLIFYPYAATSILAVTILFYITHQFYKTLENNNLNLLQQPSTTSILITRTTAYSLTTPKKLFTGNFIVPLLSNYVGLEKLALIKYASYTAESAHAIIKATIGFSGNALLSAISQTKHHAKQIAFSLISQKLAIILCSFITIFISSLPLLSKLWESNTKSQLTIIYSFLFLLLMMMDHLFLMYEQFYLMEQKAYILLAIRGLELSLFYATLKINNIHSILLLLFLIMIRAISFIFLMLHGFKKWRLIPHFAISKNTLIKIILSSSTLSALTYYLIFA